MQGLQQAPNFCRTCHRQLSIDIDDPFWNNRDYTFCRLCRICKDLRRVLFQLVVDWTGRQWIDWFEQVVDWIYEINAYVGEVERRQVSTEQQRGQDAEERT